MPQEDYRRALESATREYEQLGAKRREIDQRLAELAQSIGTLSKLLGLTPTVPMGLTDAIPLVVRGAGVPMTPLEGRADARGRDDRSGPSTTVFRRGARGGLQAAIAAPRRRLRAGRAREVSGARTVDRDGRQRLHDAGAGPRPGADADDGRRRSCAC